MKQHKANERINPFQLGELLTPDIKGYETSRTTIKNIQSFKNKTDNKPQEKEKTNDNIRPEDKKSNCMII